MTMRVDFALRLPRIALASASQWRHSAKEGHRFPRRALPSRASAALGLSIGSMRGICGAFFKLFVSHVRPHFSSIKRIAMQKAHMQEKAKEKTKAQRFHAIRLETQELWPSPHSGDMERNPDFRGKDQNAGQFFCLSLYCDPTFWRESFPISPFPRVPPFPHRQASIAPICQKQPSR